MAVQQRDELTSTIAPTDWASTTTFGRYPDAAPAPAALPRPKRPPNNFDALRLAAALLVLYGHQALLTGTEDSTGTVGLRLLMFFAISGFLVSGSWRSDPHAGRFLIRRFLRVWPAYAVMVVVCATAAYVWAPTNLHRLAALFYLNNLYFFGFDWSFFSGRWPTLNQSMWMVPYEIDLYLAFVALACLGRRALVGLSMVAWLWAITASQPTTSGGGLLEAWSPFFAGFFAAGVLLRRFEFLRQGRSVLVAIVLGVVALILGHRSLGLLLVIPPAAVWVGLRSWPVVRSAARFGDLSYGVFLWAWPVQQLTHLWLPHDASLLHQLAVVLPPVVGLAWLSWRFIEAPAMRLRPAVPARRPGLPSGWAVRLRLMAVRSTSLMRRMRPLR